MKNIKTILALHILLMIYSLNSIFSKYASFEEFLSFKWCLYYGSVIFLLGIYAIGWQQIIKKMPLTSAYANKAVTVIWGIIWGLVFFHEKITPNKIIGAILITIGVVIFALSDKESTEGGEK